MKAVSYIWILMSNITLIDVRNASISGTAALILCEKIVLLIKF